LNPTDKRPMRLVLSQLIEHANWTSRSWVEATLHALGEAIREANAADREVARRLAVAEMAPNVDDKAEAVFAALQACRPEDGLRDLGLRFLKLRAQYRPIWSSELAVAEAKFASRGGLVAVHRRRHDTLS
jgi:hypothetical protein